MNMMVTSRPIPRIEREFEDALQADIRATDQDVQTYLDGRMHELVSRIKH